jgi:hypothetical protein
VILRRVCSLVVDVVNPIDTNMPLDEVAVSELSFDTAPYQTLTPLTALGNLGTSWGEKKPFEWGEATASIPPTRIIMAKPFRGNYAPRISEHHDTLPTDGR